MSRSAPPREILSASVDPDPAATIDWACWPGQSAFDGVLASEAFDAEVRSSFCAGLRLLYAQVGSPPLSRLAAMAARTGRRLPISTAHRLLRVPGRPRWRTVESFVLACRALRALHPEQAQAGRPELLDVSWWRHHYGDLIECAGSTATELRSATAEGPVNLRYLPPDPCLLGVAPCIRVPGQSRTLPDQPTYVARHHDYLLGHAARTARLTGQMVVLRGQPGSGKTRSAYEMLRALPAEWTLWQPDPLLLRGDAFAAAVKRRAPAMNHTVVWLDGLEEYVDEQHQVVASALATLAHVAESRSVLVLATVDTFQWSRLVGACPSLAAVLGRRTLKVPSDFWGYADAVAEAAAVDGRWRLAVARSPERPAQFLAGAADHQRQFAAASPAEQRVMLAYACRRHGSGQRALTAAQLGDTALHCCATVASLAGRESVTNQATTAAVRALTEEAGEGSAPFRRSRWSVDAFEMARPLEADLRTLLRAEA